MPTLQIGLECANQGRVQTQKCRRHQAMRCGSWLRALSQCAAVASHFWAKVSPINRGETLRMAVSIDGNSLSGDCTVLLKRRKYSTIVRSLSTTRLPEIT